MLKIVNYNVILDEINFGFKNVYFLKLYSYRIVLLII